MDPDNAANLILIKYGLSIQIPIHVCPYCYEKMNLQNDGKGHWLIRPRKRNPDCPICNDISGKIINPSPGEAARGWNRYVEDIACAARARAGA